MNGQSQYELAIIEHEIEKVQIPQSAADGYVNATAMCKAAGKQLGHYLETGNTKAFLAELSSVIGIPISDLVQVQKGGNPKFQGTWVHPDVAVHLGQWCSPKFAVAVSLWVREWMTAKVRPAGFPYHIERYLANRSEIPPTHFSMLNEMIFALIAPLEMAGYTMPEQMIPDISMGRMFSQWLRDAKGIEPKEFPSYMHRYEDGRSVQARLYPNELLAEVRHYFHSVWLPQRAADYFKERDKNALEHLPKLLPDPTTQSIEKK